MNKNWNFKINGVFCARDVADKETEGIEGVTRAKRQKGQKRQKRQKG